MEIENIYQCYKKLEGRGFDSTESGHKWTLMTLNRKKRRLCTEKD
jgi:hypothetical protein